MTPQEQQKLKEFCDLYNSLSPTLKQVFVSQIPYGTIQNTSNASSHIDLLKEESEDMVKLDFIYCDCGAERFGHFSKCQRCLDIGSGHSGGGNF